MGLGAWLAAQTESQRYDAEIDKFTARNSGAAIMHEEVLTLFEGYGVRKESAQGVIEDLMHDQEMWLKVSTVLLDKVPGAERRLTCLFDNSSPPTWFLNCRSPPQLRQHVQQ